MEDYQEEASWVGGGFLLEEGGTRNRPVNKGEHTRTGILTKTGRGTTEHEASGRRGRGSVARASFVSAGARAREARHRGPRQRRRVHKDIPRYGPGRSRPASAVLAGFGSRLPLPGTLPQHSAAGTRGDPSSAPGLGLRTPRPASPPTPQARLRPALSAPRPPLERAQG